MQINNSAINARDSFNSYGPPMEQENNDNIVVK